MRFNKKPFSKTHEKHRDNALQRIKNYEITGLDEEYWVDFQTDPLKIMMRTEQTIEAILAFALCNGTQKSEAYLVKLLALLQPWLPRIANAKPETCWHLFIVIEFYLAYSVVIYWAEGTLNRKIFDNILDTLTQLCRMSDLEWPSNSVSNSDEIPECIVLGGLLIEILSNHPTRALQVMQVTDKPKAWRKPFWTFGHACAWLGTYLNDHEQDSLNKADQEMDSISKIWWSSTAREFADFDLYLMILLWITRYAVTGNNPSLESILDDFRGYSLIERQE